SVPPLAPAEPKNPPALPPNAEAFLVAPAPAPPWPPIAVMLVLPAQATTPSATNPPGIALTRSEAATTSLARDLHVGRCRLDLFTGGCPRVGTLPSAWLRRSSDRPAWPHGN